MRIEDYKKAMNKIEIREECRKEIIEMSAEKNNSGHRWSKKKIIPVMAAAVIGCTAMSVAFADDIISVFSKAKNTQEITVENSNGDSYKVNKGDQLNYDKLEKHAELLSESCETDGLKVTASSSFCDGENMTVIFTAENSNPDIKNDISIWAKGISIEINGKTYTDTYQETAIWLNLFRDSEDTSTYTGTLQFPVPEESRFSQPTDIKIKVGSYEMTDGFSNDGTAFKGSGEFLIKVTPDTSANTENNNTYQSDDGRFVVESVKSTPYALSVKNKMPLEGSYDMLVYDENGNRLDINIENQGYYDGEYSVSNFTATDSKTITVKFIDKSSDNLDEICSFEIPLE